MGLAISFPLDSNFAPTYGLSRLARLSMPTHDQILQRLRDRIAQGSAVDSTLSSNRIPFAPTTVATLVRCEQELGFALPPLLGRIYTEVANGGFGPGYGFLGLYGGVTNEDRHTLAEFHRGTAQASFRKRFPEWPSQTIRVCNWGCAMYSCIDCATSDFQVWHFEPNPSAEELGFVNCLIPHKRGFDAFLEAWLDGVDVFNDVFPGYADTES